MLRKGAEARPWLSGKVVFVGFITSTVVALLWVLKQGLIWNSDLTGGCFIGTFIDSAEALGYRVITAEGTVFFVKGPIISGGTSLISTGSLDQNEVLTTDLSSWGGPREAHACCNGALFLPPTSRS